ncbi:hypothetical protein J2797_002179 [Paraburkholderia terricola]|jgi:hypothetical protein|uniref:Uncharacterized protein n=1 Tax=Paraburkholderia terricola TaxID=169427 RepID=A0A1M6M9R4_9BURK|nr:hypothetical protein [Paraburkholderia terricola]SDN97150.1 hypothetical protein SAMN05192547_10079 [Paraburkholderia sediminicola]SHJ80164.1 hypothetical protein SAMN05192548_10079 [Paraburkholderia terricola]
MHAPYAAQYCVIGGSGAGSGGSFTLDAAVVGGALAAVVSEAPSFASAAALVAGALAVVALAALVVEAGVAVAALAADGMLAPIGEDEKLLEGNGGRDGAPVDEDLAAGGLRGGICGSRAMLTLVCLFAAAKHSALSTLRWYAL